MKVAAKNFLVCILLTALAAYAPKALAQAATKERASVKTLVIDAGHGGKDPGTSHGGYREKDITLKVALLLGDMVGKNLPDVKVVYTRSTDVYVELDKRGDIANKAGADLFMSIHVDATTTSSASGCSTFVMGTSKSQANLDVAMRENDVVSYEKDYTTKYQGYVPGSAESFIIFSLMQYAYMDQSMSFAEIIQKHYKANQTAVDRGARQAPYLVLWRTAMPSVLTEIGFLSNERDRKFVASDAGQRKVARSLFNAFSEYKSKVEGRAKTVLLTEDGPDGGNGAVAATTPGTDAVADQAAAQDAGNENGTVFGRGAAAPGGITFAVQVRISYTPISPNDKVFGPYRGKVAEKKIGKLYKYYIGECTSYKEAMAAQGKARQTVKDAFVVAFRDGEPIPVGEARKISGQ